MTTAPINAPQPDRRNAVGIESSDWFGGFWICWTNNCRGRADDQLYVIHATTDTGRRTLCGCEIQEVGEPLGPDNTVSCKRCKRAMPNDQVSNSGQKGHE